MWGGEYIAGFIVHLLKIDKTAYTIATIRGKPRACAVIIVQRALWLWHRYCGV